ncbi:MAG: hypothetical protein V7L04_31830 [Nostoc sp.]|uniref:hypothetical protein n=1 Tax=Nostoc sp. TaxID=1180 RepID=UPI002FFA3A75
MSLQYASISFVNTKQKLHPKPSRDSSLPAMSDRSRPARENVPDAQCPMTNTRLPTRQR